MAQRYVRVRGAGHDTLERGGRAARPPTGVLAVLAFVAAAGCQGRGPAPIGGASV